MCSHWVWVLADASAKVFMHCACLRFAWLLGTCNLFASEACCWFWRRLCFSGDHFLYDSCLSVTPLAKVTSKISWIGQFPRWYQSKQKKMPANVFRFEGLQDSVMCHDDIKFHLSARVAKHCWFPVSCVQINFNGEATKPDLRYGSTSWYF